MPAVLEMLGIPYTGSDPLTLAAALDKDVAKRLVRAAGVAVPDGLDDRARRRGPRRDRRTARRARPPGPRPLDRQAGLRRVEQGHPQPAASSTRRRGGRRTCSARWPRDYEQPILVEEFIAGDEVTVGLIGNGRRRRGPRHDARPSHAIASSRFVYSLEVKRDWSEQRRLRDPRRLLPEP